MFAGVGHEAVVFGGQGGVDAAGLAGGHEQCLPQDRVTAFGRAAVSTVETRRIKNGNQAGEGSGAGEGAEPVRVAEPPQDRGGGDRGDTGSRGDDSGRVGFTQQQRGPFVEIFDLLGQLQRQPGLDGDVFGKVGVVQLTAGPQLEGLVGAASSASTCGSPQAPRECR